MINEIVKKIDGEIEELIEFRDKQEQRFAPKLNGIINGLKKAKKIILLEQKSATDINVATKTKGDVIRESNESLAVIIYKSGTGCECRYCACQNSDRECLDNGCVDGILQYLNQPQEDTK